MDELALSAVEARIEADLALGRHGDVAGELEALCQRHPLRERLWELLMLALYRAGRQADALRAFGEARTALVEELGIDPGPALKELEARVLAQDPTSTRRPRIAWPAVATGRRSATCARRSRRSSVATTTWPDSSRSPGRDDW